jgi:ABC-2 type transport system permease protein
MFKRELKVNFKSFTIWLTILIALFLLVFLMYPAIIEGGDIKQMNEMMKVFPEEILKAFNMDITSIDSAFGWLKSEGFVFVLLIIGCYSGMLGSNILLKEESDKTIEYLSGLPVKRSNIVLSKVAVGLIYIILMVIIIGIFNYIGLQVSGEFDRLQYILLSITPIFSSIPIFFICMFVSTFTHKIKKVLGISLGIVLISYVLQLLSSLSETTEFLKYLSVFTLSDIRNVILNISINPAMIVISTSISLIFFLLITIRYEKKELV